MVTDIACLSEFTTIEVVHRGWPGGLSKPTPMTILPQPPPNAPAPPPSDVAILSRRKWMWLWIAGLFSMLIVVLLLGPLFIRQRHHGCGQTETVSNARQIGLALFEFETEYGKFPDATTSAAVKAETGTLLPLGAKTSNDFFRQLIAAEISQSEVIFYAKTVGGRKPDNVFDATHALERRECGFTYLLGATKLSNPSRPIVVTPMIPGTDRFDPEPFKGKAVILRIDNSVTSLPIDKSGHVIVNGRNLMDPHHPIWDGHAPVIAWPDL